VRGQVHPCNRIDYMPTESNSPVILEHAYVLNLHVRKEGKQVARLLLGSGDESLFGVRSFLS
jgi:hypothetical protein